MGARREHGIFDPNTELGQSPFDHFVYVLAGEGDMEEGITSEASSLAGTQNLGNLIVIFDDNKISIEDDTRIAFSEDVLARYEAYGWHTQHVAWRNDETGEYEEDVVALYDAIKAAQEVTDRPSIIKLSTIIAWPTPGKMGSGAAHGSALGDDAIAGLKKAVGFDPEKTFEVADEVIAYTRKSSAERAAKAHEEWDAAFNAWREANPDKGALLDRLLAGELPEGWTDALPVFEPGKAIATRAASGKILTALKDVLPELWGGSADLAGSNNTTMEGEPSFLPVERSSKKLPGNPFGRTLHFGIRDHAMGAILNGISVSGLTRPYGGTFFVFADYMRPAVRVAAIMEVPSIFVWTHDSVGVGEDGPTHQPIEHLWSYRAIPHLDIVRPADANETAYAWRGILERAENPTGLVLSRQNLPVFERGDGEANGDTLASAAGVLRGGYVLADAETLDVILIATGSEVRVALAAREELAREGIGARVVSMPSLEWFAEQDEDYRESVLPKAVKARVSVEAGATFGWAGIVGDAGRAIGIDHFGASADGEFLLDKFGVNPAAVVSAAKESLNAVRG